MALAAITTRFLVQLEIGGKWKDRAQYDLFSQADDMAQHLQENYDVNVRVVEREIRDTICLGYRDGDKAMRKGR